MKKITQASIKALLDSQMSLLASDSSEQYSVAYHGFKGFANMTQEELETEFKSHGIKPVYEDA